MEKIKNFFVNNEWVIVLLLVAVFILIRLPGVDLPLHQDEYKWPLIVNPANASEVSIPHPPLSQFIYRTAGYIVGFNVNFRFVPLFFGTLNLLLLYYLMRFLFGRKEAVIASVIWVFSYFSVLASLMVDTDGQIMPFFFLLALIGYFKLKFEAKNKVFWATLLIIALVCGFFTKVSFLLAIGAIVADFLWSQRHKINKKQAIKYGGYSLGGLGILVLLLVTARFIFPFFNLSDSIKYWEHFFVFDRGWFQTIIQCAKAVLYTSPFLIVTPLLSKKEDLSKTAVFIFFLVFSFIFYVILFDFSIGALDRYLQLVILPLTVLSSVVLVRTFKDDNRRLTEYLLLATAVSLVIVLLQSLPHYVPPLHPKSEWIGRILSLRWNFVYPFSGGSGPLGFYVSFLFMAVVWIFSISAFVTAKIKSNYKKLSMVLILTLGLSYNAVFIEEYLLGYWNGHAPKLLTDAMDFIKNNSDIKMVTAYNDNGGNELQQIGKYRKRLYVDPKFDINEKIATLNKYKEHYFVLDVPRIDSTSVYKKYFDSCAVIYKATDQKMSATIYDCRQAPDLKK